MPKIDEKRKFIPVHIAVLTVSDTRDEESDKSGRVLKDCIAEAGHVLKAKALVKDDKAAITAQVKKWIADPEVDAVIATGGTGITGRDVTPEAFRALYEKEIEGFGELFRILSFQIIGSSTIQSRATAGIANGTYLFALP
ncbi:MAG TPA: molybdenum cofactor synthesis domain-containing protein, partial [Sphingomonadales bacterium]|nr:molybdenum cofactor synthesis domain-containing protein [Sphingomonadales bacterium]